MKVLIISTKIKETPPLGYGGIERVVWSSFQDHLSMGHDTTLISKGMHDQLSFYNLESFDLIECHDQDPDSILLVDSFSKNAKIYMHNQFRDKLNFLKYVKNTIVCVSKYHAENYSKHLNKNIVYEEYLLDGDKFKPLNLERKGDIIFVGIIGSHKSPLYALRKAKEYSLKIDFYGPISFRDDEKEYGEIFLKELLEYTLARYMGILFEDKKVNVLNNYKWFAHYVGKDKMYWEAYGIAPLEALACGLTVLVGDLKSQGHSTFCKIGVNSSFEPDVFYDPERIRSSISSFLRLK